jgi:hypothetical protein
MVAQKAKVTGRKRMARPPTREMDIIWQIFLEEDEVKLF